MMTIYYLFLSTWPGLTLFGLMLLDKFYKPKGKSNETTKPT